MPPTLTLDDAAALLFTTAETVSQAIHQKDLPAARIGRQYVLLEEDVLDWVRAQYGNWRKGEGDGQDSGQGGQAQARGEDQRCGSIRAARPGCGGVTSAKSAASALAAALAPRTGPRRRSGPPPLRRVSGGRND
jgi:excisionase family DNA binding protein